MRVWLKSIRRAKGFTQEQVAELVGITQQFYSFVESGRRDPHQKTAKKIADLLGFDWTKFFSKEFD